MGIPLPFIHLLMRIEALSSLTFSTREGQYASISHYHNNTFAAVVCNKNRIKKDGVPNNLNVPKEENAPLGKLIWYQILHIRCFPHYPTLC